jgi:hypothetical protein
MNAVAIQAFEPIAAGPGRPSEIVNAWTRVTDPGE